jgi:hypothetical protein
MKTKNYFLAIIFMITVIFLVNNVEALCNDSDVTADYPDGKNIYTSGYVTYCRGENSCYTLNDICRTRRDTSYVYERYCNNNSMPRISYAKCDDGCDGNACKIVATCTDDCSTSGDKQCSGNGYQTCGNYDNDSCLEWSTNTNCATDEICKDGACEDKVTCTETDKGMDALTKATTIGYAPGTYDVISKTDICNSNVLTEYWCLNNYVNNTKITCIYGCTNGTCNTYVPTCSDDCSTGDKQCSGNGYQTCGNYDNDSCLEWSSTTNCYSNQTCTDGECVATCTDDCSTSGAKKCDGTTGYQTCGNYDTDSCLEWSSTTNCDYTKTCKSGNCVKKEWPIGLVTFECNVNDGCYFTNNLETDDELIITLKIEPESELPPGEYTFTANMNVGKANSDGMQIVTLTLED